jgi:hypothetical protein
MTADTMANTECSTHRMLLTALQLCFEALPATKLLSLHRKPEQVHKDVWDVSGHMLVLMMYGPPHD